MNERLDLKDKRILYELELNARIPETTLAKRIGLSKEVVRYRLKKLEKEGIISKYHAVINSMNLGKLMYRTYFKLRNVDLEKEKEIFSYLKRNYNWITKIRGSWDIGTMILVKGSYEFERMLNSFLAKYGLFIEDYRISIMTKLHHCKRSYLLNKKDNTDIILCRSNNPIKLDKLDNQLLSHLTNFGRAKYHDMAEKFMVNEKLVRDRIKRLIENKIIMAFTPFLNISKLGMKFYKVHFRLEDKSREIVKKMISFGIGHKNIIYMVEGIGCEDIEIEVQVDNSKELFELIDLYRKNFKEKIRDYIFMEYTNEYKFDYNSNN